MAATTAHPGAGTAATPTCGGCGLVRPLLFLLRWRRGVVLGPWPNFWFAHALATGFATCAAGIVTAAMAAERLRYSSAVRHAAGLLVVPRHRNAAALQSMRPRTASVTEAWDGRVAGRGRLRPRPGIRGGSVSLGHGAVCPPASHRLYLEGQWANGGRPPRLDLGVRCVMGGWLFHPWWG